MGQIKNLLDSDIDHLDLNASVRAQSASSALMAEKKARGKANLSSIREYLAVSRQLGTFRGQISVMRARKELVNAEVDRAVASIHKIANFINSEESSIEAINPERILQRLKNNLFNQLSSLTDKCTPEQLDRLDAELDKLEEVFAAKQQNMQAEMQKQIQQVTAVNPHSLSQISAVQHGSSPATAARQFPYSSPNMVIRPRKNRLNPQPKDATPASDQPETTYWWIDN